MDTSKLAKRLARLQEKSSGGEGKNIWFKSGEEKTKIRQVPYPHEVNGEPFIEVYFHFNVAGHRSIVCPKMTHGQPCPICELAEEFKSMGNKDSWKMYKKLAPKLRTYSPVIVRGKEDDGIKLWGYGSTIYESLLEKYMDPEWGDLSDPKSGRDLTVWTIKQGSTGNDTEFDKPKMDVSPNSSPMLTKKSDIIKLLEGMPNYLNDGATFPVRSYQELQEIVRKLADVDDEEEDDVPSKIEKFIVEDSSDEDDDDSDDDLSAKLKKLLD